MKKITILATITALASLLVFTGWSTLAQDEVEDPQPPEQDDELFQPGMRFMMMQEELGITDEQLETLSNARTEFHKQMIRLNADIEVAMIDMRELMKGYGNDDAVMAKMNEMKALKVKAGELRMQHQLQMRSVFTKEQWDKISKLRNFGRQRGFGRDGMRGPGREMGREKGRPGARMFPRNRMNSPQGLNR